MMLIEEQRREPIRVSYSPKPLDTTTQESSYSEFLNQSINNMCSLSLEGKKIKNDDLFDLLGKVLSNINKNSVQFTPVQFDLLQKEHVKILQEKNMEVARKDVSDFIDKLKNLGADNRVCNIFSKQFELHFRLSECYNEAAIGKLLKDDDIKFVLDMIPGISAGGSENCYQYYQLVLKEKDMEVAKKAASDFIDKLKNLGADDKVCNIFSNRFDSGLLLNKYYNAANIGEYLKDDAVKLLFNVIPGISAKKIDELCLDYKYIVQDRAREWARNFIDALPKLGVDEKICNIISKQFELYFFFDEYYDKQEVDTASIRRLLNKIPRVSSESIDELCKEYEDIINKKDRDGTVDFIKKLRGIGANEFICDIIQIEFCKAEIILPAEVRPSISGNLFVPKDAKFKKRYENGCEFQSEECGNVTLAEELDRSFMKLIVEPYEECKSCLPAYIEPLLKEEKPSPRPKEKLREMLDILTSVEIDEAFKNSLKVVERISKDLVSGGNRANDRRLKETASYSPDGFTWRKIICDLRAVLPDEKEFKLICECIAMSYELKGRKPKSEKEKRRTTLTRTPFYDMFNVVGLVESIKFLIKFLFSSKEPLFPHDPCLSDIMQGRIGDCYLLASIISLLNSYGPDFIRNMMIDNGDGTVTVRLYAQSKTEFDEGESHVKYVKVYRHGLISNPHSALWVQIIEKAYISLGANLYVKRKEGKLEGIDGDYKNKDDRKKYTRTVEDLSGGRAYDALRVLADIKCDVFHKTDFGEEKFEKIFKEAISKKLPVTCSFESKFSYDIYNFKVKHAYSIVGIEEKGGETIVKLVDPNNAGKDVFCSFKELKEHMARCVIANTDSKTEGMGS